MRDSSSSTTTTKASKSLPKKFEKNIGDTFRSLPDVSVDRIPDQTMKYKDRKNVSDYIVFKFPHEYYVECKTVHGNRLPFSKISQFDDLLEKSVIAGVRAGVICWWVDKDITRWIPIKALSELREAGEVSVRYDAPLDGSKIIPGVKKKVYFDYDLSTFFEEE